MQLQKMHQKSRILELTHEYCSWKTLTKALTNYYVSNNNFRFALNYYLYSYNHSHTHKHKHIHHTYITGTQLHTNREYIHRYIQRQLDMGINNKVHYLPTKEYSADILLHYLKIDLTFLEDSVAMNNFTSSLWHFLNFFVN